MSSYGPHFIDPIFKKEDQAVLRETGEAQKLEHIPIKAARNNDNTTVFHDKRISKFTNYIMKGGNKVLAREIFEKCFENIKRIQLERYHLADESEKLNIETDPRKILHQAIENCRPLLQVTPIKRGGVKYQVPVPITEQRSYFLAMKWLKEAGREKEKKVHFPDKMAWELLDAAANTGRVVKKKQDLHRLCESNRAYAHYRWS